MINATVQNRLLRGLDRASWEALRPHLVPIRFIVDEILEERGADIGNVCFVESGVLSLIATSPATAAEVGMIGSEGVTGSSLVLGAIATPFDVRVRVSGSGIAVRADVMQTLVCRLPLLRSLLLKYASFLQSQFALTALAYAQIDKTTRIARWLLMAFDRTGEGELNVTHDSLSEALRIRRPGVTDALNLFEGEHAIKNRRGHIALRNREVLERFAQGTYGGAEAEYERLFPKAEDFTGPRIAAR